MLTAHERSLADLRTYQPAERSKVCSANPWERGEVPSNIDQGSLSHIGVTRGHAP